MTHRAASIIFSAAIFSSQCAAVMPRSCGTEPPEGVSISTGATHGISVLSIRRGTLTADLQLPGAMETVDMVCQSPDGRLVVFGDTGAGSSNIQIVDVSAGRIDDSFGAYTPVLSPDTRWIIFRRFYPPQTSDPSEEYLLYDLTRSARQNRAGYKAEDMDAPGVVVYPVVPDRKPFDNVFLPSGQTHSFSSRSFYWAEDSSAVAFADSVQQKLSLVVVMVSGDVTATYTYAVPDAVKCDGGAPRSLSAVGAVLANARVVISAGKVHEVRVDIGIERCPRVTVPFSEFRLAPLEVQVEHRRKHSVEAPRR